MSSGKADHRAPTDKNEQPYGLGTCYRPSFNASASTEGTLKPQQGSILLFNFSVLQNLPYRSVGEGNETLCIKCLPCLGTQ